MSCKPGPGTYNILSNIDSNAVNTCPSTDFANPVVILDDVTKVTLTLVDESACVYNIQVNGGYVRPFGDNYALQSTNDPPVSWVINLQPGDLYTIQLYDNTSLTWTDPGGSTGCGRQLSLTTLGNSPANGQLFKFMGV